MLPRLIMVVVLIAAVIVYFLRRSKKLKEMELEERLRDEYR
jgi:protein-S-isoprenylcysteine O-methyltransferase Ste14